MSWSWGEVRDAWLPARLRGEIDHAQAVDRRRTQRLITIVIVMFVGSVISGVGQVLQEMFFSGIGALIGALLMVATLFAIRRGAPVRLVGGVLMVLGVLLAATLAALSGPMGVVSLFWVGLAPLIVAAIAGQRAGRVTLVLTITVVAVTMYLASRGVFPVLFADVHIGAHVVSLAGALVTFYALSWAFQRESEASIAELERKNAQLNEARRAADEANRAKGEFLASMSHEIRTPLNGMLGMTSVLLASDLPADVRSALLTVKESGDALLAVLGNVLDFSKIESGRLEVEHVPVDLRVELKTITTLMQEPARERHNELVLDVADEVPDWLVSDPVRLRQVVLNLVSNAVKFTHHGRVTVRVRVEGSNARIDVEDTGIGMSQETLARVFTPFTQADASTTRRFGGTGLGLAIVRRLVDALGGHLEVHSELGRGSTFSVLLPAVVGSKPEASQERPTPSTRKLSLLLAEDNPINRRVATKMLEKLGHDVVVAENGAEALNALHKKSFDLVLMDCHMPVMDGFEATLAIRASDFSKLPIVALTAASLPEERERCIECGMNEVLVKPVRLDDLVNVLGHYA